MPNETNETNENYQNHNFHLKENFTENFSVDIMILGGLYLL